MSTEQPQGHGEMATAGRGNEPFTGLPRHRRGARVENNSWTEPGPPGLCCPLNPAKALVGKAALSLGVLHVVPACFPAEAWAELGMWSLTLGEAEGSRWQTSAVCHPEVLLPREGLPARGTPDLGIGHLHCPKAMLCSQSLGVSQTKVHKVS